MKSHSMPRVAIVGAGVSGLTCGVVLKANSYDVTLFERPGYKAASPVAAAIWYPYHIGGDTRRWERESYCKFEELARKPRTTGVSMVEFDVRGIAVPDWIGAYRHRLAPHGFVIEVPLIETPIYLPWLRKPLERRIEQRLIKNLSSLERKFDVVVNCSGLGAKELCNDSRLHSGRGVVLKVKNPGIARHMVEIEGETLTYVIARNGDIVLGGTDDKGRTTKASKRVQQEIFNRCVVVEPRLPVQYEPDVGLRPVRKTVRLRRQPNTRIIHNYGHGGAGFTVSWGCAYEVLRIVQSLSNPG